MFESLPEQVRYNIRSVRLILSKDDVAKETSGLSKTQDLLEKFEGFQDYCRTTEDKLETIWREKAHAISRLKLNHLIIDISDAFSPSGEFLGLRIASSFQFAHGIPERMEIIATSQVQADALRCRIKHGNRAEYRLRRG